MAVYIFPSLKALMTGINELHRRRNNVKIETAIITHLLSPCQEVNSVREEVAGAEGPQGRKQQQRPWPASSVWKTSSTPKSTRSTCPVVRKSFTWSAGRRGRTSRRKAGRTHRVQCVGPGGGAIIRRCAFAAFDPSLPRWRGGQGVRQRKGEGLGTFVTNPKPLQTNRVF